jgi:predicted phage tail protein
MSIPPVDLRHHARQTKRRLFAGGLGLVFVVGTVLIAVTYGTPAAGCGVAFFLVALIPIGLISLVLAGLQWISNRSKQDDAEGGKTE